MIADESAGRRWKLLFAPDPSNPPRRMPNEPADVHKIFSIEFRLMGSASHSGARLQDSPHASSSNHAWPRGHILLRERSKQHAGLVKMPSRRLLHDIRNFETGLDPGFFDAWIRPRRYRRCPTGKGPVGLNLYHELTFTQASYHDHNRNGVKTYVYHVYRLNGYPSHYSQRWSSVGLCENFKFIRSNGPSMASILLGANRNLFVPRQRNARNAGNSYIRRPPPS